MNRYAQKIAGKYCMTRITRKMIKGVLTLHSVQEIYDGELGYSILRTLVFSAVCATKLIVPDAAIEKDDESKS